MRGEPIPTMTETDIARFVAKVRKTAGCWLWVGAKDRGGYGQLYLKHKVRAAHRIALKVAGIEIPAGMHVDHTCRNRLCVRPSHLRVVDERTNAVENNTSPFAVNARKTHCVNGHPFTPENTSIHLVKNRKNRHGNPSKPSPGRVCLVCKRERYHREKKLVGRACNGKWGAEK